MPVLELDSSQATTPGIYSYVAKAELPGQKGAPEYICPTEIGLALEHKEERRSGAPGAHVG